MSRLRLTLSALCLALALAGCAGTIKSAATPSGWQKLIREPDRKRLARLYSAWTRSLVEAKAGGSTEQLAALGPLVLPDGSVEGNFPAPGAYTCRTIKLGRRANGKGPLAAKNAPPLMLLEQVPCSIGADENAGVLTFIQAPGKQWLGGRLFPDDKRLVFLGSLALAGETGVRRYGADPDRDQVGVLRPMGENRWRLELPWPNWQSNLEVIEITPA